MISGKGTTSSSLADIASQSASSDRVRLDAELDCPARARRQHRVVSSAADGAAPAGFAQLRPLEPSALVKNLFLKELHREMRRSDRSLSPLSLVVYQIDETVASPRFLARLLEVLDGAKRETDIVGHAGNNLIAVLCPDTDEQGVKGFKRKIDARMFELPFTAICATYPDELFDSVATGVPTRPELSTLLHTASTRARSDGYALKRSLDIVGATAALVLFGPVMLLTAAAIAATSRGPIIFRQPRLGKGGRPFTFYKFRSMETNADDRVHREFVANLINAKQSGERHDERGSAPYKLGNDLRITRVGKFIRKTSIDELPQLFSVLKGDMTLVGPRPPIPYEIAHYQPWHLRRILSIKPGITGLWQVAGRSRVTFNEMVRMDLRYIRDCSLILDLNILVKTFVAVILCKGAS